ncbi:MAG: DUF922 domain-containing protein [Roseateles sp.]|uniref:DUF922 domain-containing protein n=1 Tax=Roseateles sp. TaxID=1971397 RepID=UPI00403711BF
MGRGLLLALLGSVHAACFGHVTETAERLNYEVRQRPGMSLLQALNHATPIRGENGRPFFGHTQWRVNWQYRYDVRPDGLCGITSVAVKLAVTMTLPALKESTAAVAAQFASYLPALIEHEEGHRRVGQAAAQQVDSAIAQMAPMASCRLLEAEANRLATERVERATREDKAYDAATQYGCTQGACLQR